MVILHSYVSLPEGTLLKPSSFESIHFVEFWGLGGAMWEVFHDIYIRGDGLEGSPYVVCDMVTGYRWGIVIPC